MYKKAMTITWSLGQLFSRATPLADADVQMKRWRTLLHWAVRSPYYTKERAILEEAAGRESVGALLGHLTQLRPVPLSWFVENAQGFSSGYGRLLEPQKCSSLWETRARIALVHPWFRTEEPARAFLATEPLAKTAKALNRYGPDVIAGSPAVLRKLVRTGLKGPRRAIVAVHGPGAVMLPEAERDLLWRRFKVPVYQQLRGFQGELLAAECDAQVGFHVNAAAAHWEAQEQELLYTSLFDLRHPVLRLATGWCGDLETSRCGCGCLTARLFPYERRTAMRRGISQGAA